MKARSLSRGARVGVRTGHTLRQLASFNQREYGQVRALQYLQLTPAKLDLSRPAGRGPSKEPDIAVDESSFQAGGRLEIWRGCF